MLFIGLGWIMALGSCVNQSSSPASFRASSPGNALLNDFLGCVRCAGKLISSWRPFLRMFSGVGKAVLVVFSSYREGT